MTIDEAIRMFGGDRGSVFTDDALLAANVLAGEVVRLREDYDVARKLAEVAHAGRRGTESVIARVESVLRDNRAPDGKWYVDAGTLVARLEAALRGTVAP